MNSFRSRSLRAIPVFVVKIPVVVFRSDRISNTNQQCWYNPVETASLPLWGSPKPAGMPGDVPCRASLNEVKIREDSRPMKCCKASYASTPPLSIDFYLSLQHLVSSHRSASAKHHVSLYPVTQPDTFTWVLFDIPDVDHLWLYQWYCSFTNSSWLYCFYLFSPHCNLYQISLFCWPLPRSWLGPSSWLI